MTHRLKELLERNISELGVPQRAMSCAPEISLQAAVFQMRENKIGSLVIVADRKVKGIFTERDFLEKVALKGEDMSNLPISSLMTSNPVCVKRNESIGSVLEKMRNGKFRHIIITDSYDHLEKVVSIREITEYLTSSFAQKK